MANQCTLELYKDLSLYNVSLAYSGIFTDDLTNNFILFCEDLIIEHKQDPKTAKTVNFLLCESFQNIVRHTNSSDNAENKNLYKGYFGFHNKLNDYRFNSINAIEVQDKIKAIDLIESVNNKNADELKSLYRERLKDNAMSEKGGAGLGYIQMARKSGKNILYKISSSNDNIDRWHQQIMISEKQETKHTNRIDMTNEQFEKMIDSNQILQYKGDFSLDRLKSMSGIVNANLKLTDHTDKTKAIINDSFAKLFENVDKHGAPVDGHVEGSLVVSELEDSFVIEMGNPIANANKADIVNKLSTLQKKTIESENPTSLEGMILNNNLFQFEIHDLNDINSFLVIRFKVLT